MASWFTDVPDTKYDYLWSSRKVVKNQYYNKEASAGYYGCDIWGEAHSKLSPYLTKIERRGINGRFTIWY